MLGVTVRVGVCKLCREQSVGFGGVSPMFLGSGEISLCLRNARAPTGAAAISLKPLLHITTQHRSLCGPRGPEEETPISSFDSLRGAKLELISVAAVPGFLSGAVSASSSSSALMGLLILHLAVCLEITFWRDSLPGKRCCGHYLAF